MYVDKKIAFILAASITTIADLVGSAAVQCMLHTHECKRIYAYLYISVNCKEDGRSLGGWLLLSGGILNCKFDIIIKCILYILTGVVWIGIV